MNYKNLLKPLFIIIILSLLSLSCDNGVQQEQEVYAPEYMAPVVTGIILTGWDSPEPIGKSGNPSINHKGKFIYMHSGYSNPSNGAVAFEYTLTRKTKVKMWAVRAKTPNDLSTEGSGVFNAGLVSPPEKIVLFPETEQSSGMYRHVWEYTDFETGTKFLPGGFYRVYIQAGDDLVWDDILVDYYNYIF